MSGAFTIRMTFGDVDRDGDSDLAVAENNQLSVGSGRLSLYSGTAEGLFTSPTWSSEYSGYGSEVVLADANADGWLDLLGGSWGQNRIFESPIRAVARYER